MRYCGRVGRENGLIKGCIAKYEITVQFSLDLETFPFEKLSLSKNFPLLLVRKWFNQRVHQKLSLGPRLGERKLSDFRFSWKKRDIVVVAE